MLRLSLLLCCFLPLALIAVEGDDIRALRKAANGQFVKENWVDALALYRRVVLHPAADASATELTQTWDCLRRAQLWDQVDPLVADLTQRYDEGAWRQRLTLAEILLPGRGGVNLPTWARQVDGQWRRAHQGQGPVGDLAEHDRWRALNIIESILPSLSQQHTDPAVSQAYLRIAHIWHSHPQGLWALQLYTNLDNEPDPAHPQRDSGFSALAPVEADGSPLFFETPESWAAATSDIERMLWLWDQARQGGDSHIQSQADRAQAGLAQQWYGVQTLGSQPPLMLVPDDDGGQQEIDVRHLMSALGDHETIARIASGVRRFDLPPAWDYMAIYARIAAHAQRAEEYEHRRQYPQAVEAWQLAGQPARAQLITGDAMQFGAARSVALGMDLRLPLVYRNVEQITVSAQRIDLPAILKELREWRAQIRQHQNWWDSRLLSSLGQRLMAAEEGRWIRDDPEERRWTVELQPAADHLPSHHELRLALDHAGPWVITARSAGGALSRNLVWVVDTVLMTQNVRQDGQHNQLHMVVDARDGQPLAGAEVRGQGIRVIQNRNGSSHLIRDDYRALTNEMGLVWQNPRETSSRHPLQWLLWAQKGERLAVRDPQYLSWSHRSSDGLQGQRTALVTDRPIYRPGQRVLGKVWHGMVNYDEDNSSTTVSGVPLTIHDPQGERLEAMSLRLDQWGGATWEWTIPDDARLGVYTIYSGNKSLRIRVEEFRSPEFSVQIQLPDAPIALGEVAQAKVRAQYVWGAAVREAEVRYRIERRHHYDNWFPEHEWDWLYGAGFWWRGVARPWFDDWQSWHRSPPHGHFSARNAHFAQRGPPELVASGVVTLDAEGTASIPIDTAQARALYANADHRYTITVEATDASRRTEVGSGQLIAARQPFHITAWTWQGFQRVGDHGRWQVRARSAAGQPVAASGSAELRQLRFDQHGVLSESVVATWDVACDENGAAELPVHWREPGQYRLWLSLRHNDARVDSSQIVNVLGAADDQLPAGSFRSAPLELHLAQATLSPGEEAEILITSSRPTAHIMLFPRVAGHAASGTPDQLSLVDGAAVYRLPITSADYPNIFVEAIAVVDGQVYRETLQIPVPPAQRLLQVEIEPVAKRVQPGEATTLNLRIRDEQGQPLRGSAVIAVTDSALDLLAGDLRPGPLREAFWSQRRQYHASLRHSLPPQGSMNLLRHGDAHYHSIGVFGDWSPERALAMRLSLQEDSEQSTVSVISDSDRLLDEMSVGDFYSEPKGREQARSRAELGGAGAFMAIGAGGGAARGAMDMVVESAASAPAQAEVELPQPVVRQNFADTALWVGALTLDENGRASVELTLPDNLTTWTVRSWAVAHNWRVGQAQSTVVAAKDVLVRLHAPRFATEGDVFALSATVHNELAQAISAVVDLSLDLEEGAESPLTLPTELSRQIEVPAGGEVRVSWNLRASGSGPVALRASVRSQQGGDAVESRLPIHIYGAETTQSQALVLIPDQQSGTMTLRVPEERIPEASELILRWSPSAAAAVLEAIPYLADYPYGCTEQTLNRFVPAVVALQLLESSGVDLAALRQSRASVNPGQLASAAQRWDRRRSNPVFDPHQVRSMVREGVERLARMQLSDGGWGWFSGNQERSLPHTTVVVVRGLLIARAAGAEVNEQLITRGLGWLKRYRSLRITSIEDSIALVKKGSRSQRDTTTNIDAYIESVLSDAGHSASDMRGWLLEDRSRLSTYGKALLGLVCLASEDQQGLTLILENLGQFVERRDDNHSAWLRVESPWWNWYGSEYEANSAYLLLLVRAKADADLTARLARYLVASRRGNYWHSTRDTAWAVEALSAYLAGSDELRPNQQVRIFHGEELLSEEHITVDNLFTRSGTLSIPADRLGSGEHLLRIEREGEGYLHANAWLRVFSREAIIPAQGLEVTVQRRWWRITESSAADDRMAADGQAVTGEHRREQREALAADAVIKPGELIEVELIVESANDYEYILVKDRRFAGAEPVDRLSGYSQGAYREFRADHVALFLSTLRRGTHTYSYRLRAELPGTLNAMPATISGMYAPALIGNSQSRQAVVAE